MLDKGAHFFRCDLQVHSPRDRNWRGPECITEAERRSYATSLVLECRRQSLHAIAITDHHDFCFYSHIRTAAEGELNEDGEPVPKCGRLLIYPGLELTLGVPCQAIMLLDADFEENRLSSVLTALRIEPSPDCESRTIQTARLEQVTSLRTLKEELDGHTWLKDRYIILPNVSGEGQFSLLRSGMTGKYKEMPCVGGYVDGRITRLKTGQVNILAGRERAWGFKKIAVLQTSDNRDHKHALLGQYTTWIKWAVPTAEALRQACLAQESRLSHDTPRVPSFRIEGLSVSNSKFLGRISLNLNPQYNAIIGGRGTGKSSILEYIRWALCDQPPGIADEDTPDYEKRRQRLISATLRPFQGTIDVCVRVNDVLHVVRRESERGTVRLKIGSGEFGDCSEDDIRSLLPIQAYSQKQLSGVSVRIDELLRFINAPIRSELHSCDSRIAERAARLQETYSAVRRHMTLKAELEKRRLEERSLVEQAEALRHALTGLSEVDRGLLARGSGIDGADRVVEALRADLRSLSDGAQTLSKKAEANSIQAIPLADLEGNDRAMAQAVIDEYQTIMRETAILLSSVASRTDIGSASMSADGPWTKWLEHTAAFRASYKEAVARSTAERESLERLEGVEKRLAEYRLQSMRLEEELKHMGSPHDVYASERHAWRTALEERDSLISKQCDNLTIGSEGTIRARLQRSADPTVFLARLQQAISGSGLRTAKIDQIGVSIMEAEDSEDVYQNIIGELEVLANFAMTDGEDDARPFTPTLTKLGFSAADLNRLSAKLTWSEWLEISLVPIESRPTFDYKSREGDYIAFQDASSGQQATALLKVLLNQTGAPLIVDQPEEDLDNPVMQEIVELIWQAKTKRQIIFASHNANLVVNGDAELVVWCDHRVSGDQSSGEIAGEGAIDIPEAREAIKRIMEGGEAAFQLRRNKYGF